MRATWLWMGMVGCAEDPTTMGLPTQAPTPMRVDVIMGEAVGGQDARVTAYRLPQGAEVHFALSTQGTGQTCPPGAQGLCLPLAGPLVYLGSATAGVGEWASLVVRIPRNVPDGRRFSVAAVAWDVNGRQWESAAFAHETGGMGCGGFVQPVCAVNGVTYSNACEAGVEGWPVLHAGAC